MSVPLYLGSNQVVNGNPGTFFLYGYAFLPPVAGQPYLPFLATWDATPGGQSGVCIFRAITLTFSCTNGYNITLTPLVDGVALASQSFNSVAAGEQKLEHQFIARGSRISALAQWNTLPGGFRIRDFTHTSGVLRSFPK